MKVLGNYTDAPEPQQGRPKSIVINPRSFIGGGVNLGCPAYLVKDTQWRNSRNFVFDFDRARALLPLNTVDSFVATPSELQPGQPDNQILAPFVMTPVPRTGQDAGFVSGEYYPGVPVYDHSQGPNPEPAFDPLDPYPPIFVGLQPGVNSATVKVGAGLPFGYGIQATNAPTGYAVSGLPAGLSLNTTTGQIIGTITSDTLQFYSVEIEAANQYGTGYGTLIIVVTAYISVVFALTESGAVVPTYLTEISIDGGAFGPLDLSVTYTAHTQMVTRFTTEVPIAMVAGGGFIVTSISPKFGNVDMSGSTTSITCNTVGNPAVLNEGLFVIGGGCALNPPSTPTSNITQALTGVVAEFSTGTVIANLSAPSGPPAIVNSCQFLAVYNL